MRRITMTCIALALLAACTASPANVATQTTAAAVDLKTQGFTANVTNEWFPLTPGTTLLYRGVKDGENALEKYFVSDETQTIDGIPTRVVLDRLYLGGVLAETTRDYYAQDRAGNVWYFGEDTATLAPDGTIEGTDGTWRSGESGAQAGIFMLASPTVGDSRRQEYYPRHAEDQFRVVDLSVSVSVPYRSFSSSLLTEEWTPLEPDVLDHKNYVRGIGEVLESSVKGPKEQLALVSIKHA